MENEKITLGQAIDQVIGALSQLDDKTRITVIDVACKQLGIALNTTSIADPEISSTTVTDQIQNAPPTPSIIQKDIRMIREEKNPQNAKQMACIVAYYLRDVVDGDDKKDVVTTADLTKFFKQANFPLPEKISDVLPKARTSGYFEDAGRGKYKLNAVGYNLVVHNLPEKGKE